MNKIEILAPAGGFDSVIAAVRNGADAVYLGEKSFSARASAKNFDENELKKAVSYCHIHGVKVYVTINTIVFDDEFENLKSAIILAANSDVDALIVQNMGVARLAKMLVPELPLHASTQMSVHTASGVRALYEMGFKRVVLSREMSKNEIKKAAEIPVELEVFVHGALCMCVSGQCYFSAMLGSRSGNRGACAQPCRLPFSVGKQNNGYALSLKDNSLVNHIGTLQQIGVKSAKIEGRMKRPEYVAAAVRACREQRDFGFISEEADNLLKQVFSRTGFTDGYFMSRIGKNMFGTRTKDDVVSANEKIFSSIRNTYKDEIRNVDIRGKFTAKTLQSPVFEVTDGIHTVCKVSKTVCEQAEKAPLTEEKCRKQLEKTGGTAYNFKNIKIDIDDNISVPMSLINALRRDVLKELDKERAKVHNYKINDIAVVMPERLNGTNKQTVRARAAGTKLGTAFKNCEIVYIPLFSNEKEIKRLISENYHIGVEVPRGMFGREEQIEKQLAEVKKAGVKDVLCHNIGAVYTAKKHDFVLHGGFGLNLVNTFDLMWAQEYGIKDVELSFELNFERINALGGSIPRGIISYGYLPLMLCRCCPNKSKDINCKTCKNHSKMKDRKGKQFFLNCDGNCTEILNCVPLFIAHEEILNLSTNFNTLRFSVENYVETVENVKDLNAIPMLKDKFTRGLYRRGVK